MNNESVDGDNNILGAFVGNVCRGIVSPTTFGGEWLYFLTIYGDENGETVEFKTWISEIDMILDVSETMLYEIGSNTGTPDDPEIMNTYLNYDFPPILSGIPDQSIYVGEIFDPINVNDYLELMDSDLISFTVTGNENISFEFNSDTYLFSLNTEEGWIGQETVIVTVTEITENEYSDSDTVFLEVLQEDLPPVLLNIPDQVIGINNEFSINLNDYLVVQDGDDISFDYDLIGSPAVDGQPSWSLNPSSFEFSMAATVIVESRGDMSQGSENILAAFSSDGDVRAVATPIEFSDMWIYFTTIYSNTDGDTISFRFYDQNCLCDLPIRDKIVFSNNDILGDPDSPVLFRAGFLYMDVDSNGFATFTPSESLWLGTETVLFSAIESGTSNNFSSSDSILVTSIDAMGPTLSGIPDQSILMSESFNSFDLADYLGGIDNSSIVWGVSGQENLSVEFSGSVVTVSPSFNWSGSESLIFHAIEDGGNNLIGSDIVMFETTGTLEIYYGDVSLNGTISTLDASLILQYLNDSIELDYQQQLNADVSGDMTISAYDASFILQYGVELIDVFPSESGDGVLPATGNILMEDIYSEGATSISIPLYVENGDDMFSFEFEFMYDNAHLNFNGISVGENLAGFNIIYDDSDGSLKIVGASAYEDGQEGVFLNLLFDISESFNDETTEIILSELRLNENNKLYNSTSTVLFNQITIPGCMDESAQNYDPDANVNTGCIYGPSILSVYDAPDDQGGFVFLNWERNSLDTLANTDITYYSVWRFLPDSSRGWEHLDDVPASYEESYGYVAPTLMTSIPEEEIHYTFYKVKAHTENQELFYESEVDSGYSVDNIAPAIPSGLLANVSGSNVNLVWDSPVDEDFNYFIIYRSEDEEFTPSEESLIGFSIDSSFVDTPLTDMEIIYYRVSAVDIHDNESEASPIVSATLQFSMSVGYSEGWNIVGLPVEVLDAQYQILFPNAQSGTLYSFDGIYQFEVTLDIGKGYLLRLISDDPVIFTGTQINEISISLLEGWNLFSGLSSSISSDVAYGNDIIQSGTIYGLDGLYFGAETIEPGRGYWVRATEDGEFTLSSEVSAKQVSFVNRVEDANSITFSSASYTTELYFGVEIPVEELLSYSLPPTFPQMDFDVRFVGDMKVVPESGEIEVLSQSETLTIGYDITIDAGDKMEWVLSSESGDKFVLEGTGEITIQSVERFVLNRIPVIPEMFTLHQNFPNPFNPITTLSYDLPRDSDVRLSIFDMLGNRVATLVSTYQKAGYKNITWNATDSMGIPVSAGVYLYQIEAGKFIQTRKLLLLK